MIKVITFDLDGVYFPNGKVNFITALGKLGVSEDEAKRVFLKSPEMNLEYKTGKKTDDEYWTWAIQEWGIGMDWRGIVGLMIDNYSVDENIANIVKDLRIKGYKTAICSNNFPARINGLQERFRFLDNFDVAVLSYEAGECKPNKRIFQELIRKSQVEPAEIVFSDDSQENLDSAKELGITTFLFEGFDKYLEQLRGVGVQI